MQSQKGHVMMWELRSLLNDSLDRQLHPPEQIMPTNKKDHAERLDEVRILAQLQRRPDVALYSACSSVRGENEGS